MSGANNDESPSMKVDAFECSHCDGVVTHNHAHTKHVNTRYAHIERSRRWWEKVVDNDDSVHWLCWRCQAYAKRCATRDMRCFPDIPWREWSSSWFVSYHDECVALCRATRSTITYYVSTPTIDDDIDMDEL